MANHVAALSRSCFFYTRQLKPIKQSLTPEAMKTLVYAFISTRIDYCNSVFTGISGQLLQRLQAIQNAAARLITGARRSQRMTPILRQLHWLPIRKRRPILYKTAVLVYKVGTVWLRLTCRHTACQLHRMTVGVTYALLCLDN